MSEHVAGQPPWTLDQAKVRASILAMPGARECRVCGVITQGGGDGAQQHRLVCHPEPDAGPGRGHKCGRPRPISERGAAMSTRLNDDESQGQNTSDRSRIRSCGHIVIGPEHAPHPAANTGGRPSDGDQPNAGGLRNAQ